MNKKRKEAIEYAMFSHKVNKLELAEAMGMSYPTMLSKLKNIGSFRLDEYDKLNDILNLNNK
jgi:transcriptional regulator with PAS, ATPase and Fis domain